MDFSTTDIQLSFKSDLNHHLDVKNPNLPIYLLLHFFSSFLFIIFSTTNEKRLIHSQSLLVYVLFSCVTVVFKALSCFQEWEDDFLKWNPADFGNLQKIIVSPSRMWVPKLAIGNRYVYTTIGHSK